MLANNTSVIFLIIPRFKYTTISETDRQTDTHTHTRKGCLTHCTNLVVVSSVCCIHHLWAHIQGCPHVSCETISPHQAVRLGGAVIHQKRRVQTYVHHSRLLEQYILCSDTTETIFNGVSLSGHLSFDDQKIVSLVPVISTSSLANGVTVQESARQTE